MSKSMSVRAFAVAGVLASSLVSFSARAEVLKLEASGSQLEGVALSRGGTASANGQQLALTTVGAGLRSKKVGFIPFKVYVAQLLVSEPSKFVRTAEGALDSAAQMNGAALRLDFLRSVDAETVQSAFRDSLVANQVDMNRPEVTSFLNAVSKGGDADEGKALTLVLSRTHGQESVIYEDAQGKATQVAGPAGWMKTVLSIWLGSPSDSGVADLKNALLSGSI